MSRFPLCFALVMALALAACGGPPAQRRAGIPAPLDCVPFARALSGVTLRGDAGDWWRAAAGRYEQGANPEVGSVMVFARTPRLARGHVSVVSRVLSRYEIQVTHANWLHHHVTTDQLVRDISPRGDWSLVRVWWPPSDSLGNTGYPVLGFIYSGHSTSHDRLARDVPTAMRVALGR